MISASPQLQGTVSNPSSLLCNSRSTLLQHEPIQAISLPIIHVNKSLPARVYGYFFTLDLRRNLLTLAMVYNVIKAALEFFSGRFFSTWASLGMGWLFFLMEKEFRLLANLNKETTKLRRERLEFANNNMGYTLLNRKYKSQIEQQMAENAFYSHENTTHKMLNAEQERHIQQLAVEVDALHMENDRYEKLNAHHEKLIHSLANLGGEILQVVRNGLGEMTEEILEEFVDTIESLNAHREEFKEAAGNFDQKSETHLRKMDEMSAKIQVMTSENIQALREVEKQLAYASCELEEKLAILSDTEKRLKETSEILSSQIDELGSIREERLKLKKERKKFEKLRRRFSESVENFIEFSSDSPKKSGPSKREDKPCDEEEEDW